MSDRRSTPGQAGAVKHLVSSTLLGGLSAAAVVLAAVSLTSCGDRAGASEEPRAESTRRMVHRLDSLQRIAEGLRDGVPRRRTEGSSLDEMSEMIRQLPMMRFREALRSVRSGRPGNAVEIAESTLDTLATLYGDGSPPRHLLRRFSLVEGLGHLRAAVDSACVEAASSDRCLAPQVARGGPGEKAAAAAAESYRERLETGSGDEVDRWLLNLSHMVAGSYPEGVPDRWLLSPSSLSSGGELGRFRDRAPALGLDLRGNAGAAVLEDFDGDGDLDVMIASQGADDHLRYFRNDGDGTFTERTEAAGLEGLAGGLKLEQADYDNDGDVDVLVLRGGWQAYGIPNSLLRNDGDGTFTDVTERAGLLSYHPTQTAAWGDADNDGDLDLFVGNETDPSPTSLSHPTAYYRNDGDGTFTEASAATGLSMEAYVKGAVWGDVDDDGRLDLYVSILGDANRLYRNAGPSGDGTWTFEEVAAEAGVAGPARSFGADFLDYDDDGDLDLFVASLGVTPSMSASEILGIGQPSQTPVLYRNRGDGSFAEVTAEVGLDRPVMVTGSNHGDLDGDGYPDLLLGTGGPDMRALFPTRAFRNVGGERFEDVTAAAGVGHVGKGGGVSFGDVDNDGDQDVYVVYGGAYEGDVFRNALYENPGHGHGWLTLRLEGREANRSGVGARIRVVVETPEGEEREIHQRAGTGASFGSSSLQQEIGLGDAESVRSVRIRWPGSGTVDEYEDVQMNRIYRAREGSDRLEAVSAEPIDLAGEAAGATRDTSAAASTEGS